MKLNRGEVLQMTTRANKRPWTKAKCTAMVLSGCLVVLVGAAQSMGGTTITYTYDRQHRLVQASYSGSSKVCYAYDAANNLDLEVSVTDAKYLKSFLLWMCKTGDAIREFSRRLVFWRSKAPVGGRS